MVTGLFAPMTIRSRERKFQMWNFRSLELSFLRTGAKQNKTKVSAVELSLPPEHGMEVDLKSFLMSWPDRINVRPMRVDNTRSASVWNVHEA